MKLLLIDVRGLQAGATGPYGNRWVETSTLNALAAQGVVFDRHLSVHPDPTRARAAWRTGRYQFPLPSGTRPPAGPVPELLALLHDRGVRTHLMVDTSRPLPPAFLAGWGTVHEHRNTPDTLDAAGSLLAGLPADSSWLVWLELAALLPPWKVPADIIDAYFSHLPPEEEEEDGDDETDDEDVIVAEEDESRRDLLEDEEQLEPLMDPPPGKIDPADDDLYLRVQKSYAAAVSQVDILLGNLLDGMADDVLVVLTADAGQSLGEHGFIGPGVVSLHSEVVHVPLIFAGAGCRAGRHVGVLTAAVDLGPTIAQLAGGTLDGAHGHSLLGMLRDQETANWPLVGLGAEAGGQIAWGLWTPERALQFVVGPEPADARRMFVKPDDRCEVNDIAQHEMDRAEALENQLRAFVEACSRPGPLVVERAVGPAEEAGPGGDSP